VIKVRGCAKSTEILHVFGPQFFLGGSTPHEFLELHYKIDTGSDHVAKFRVSEGARRIRVEKKIKKTSQAK